MDLRALFRFDNLCLLRGNGAFLYMDALWCWNLFEYDDSNKSCASDLLAHLFVLVHSSDD